jgi:hypothetical protein
MSYTLKRFREPSTYSGIAALLVALGVALPAGLVESITYAGVGFAGILSIFLPENKK